MAKSDVISIRHTPGPHRRFVVRRGDGRFWHGGGWTPRPERAAQYGDHRAAQVAVAAVQRERHRGKPARTFRCGLTFEVAGDAVAGLTPAQVRDFIKRAVRIDVEVERYGEGPGEGNYLVARLRVARLREVRGGCGQF